MSYAETPLIRNRYRLGEALGTGGMGTVYRADDRLNGGQVALKRVALSLTGAETPSGESENIRLHLTAEFRMLASLHHPHVIAVMDYGFDHEYQPFFTMELLEGAQRITTAAVACDLGEKVRLLVESLQALAYVHRRGVLHRDLKPGNLLVDRGGKIRLLDFGLASETRRDSSADVRRQAVGTLSYMAPELFNDQPASPASDLYALGVLAFEMLAGRFPYNDKNMAVLLNSILQATPDYSGLDAGVAEVLARLLDKDPAARYQEAEAVISALCAATNQPLPEETIAVRESFLRASTFIGREDELDTLRAALKAALNGHGTAWLIGGESGVGKSRLVDEVRIMALVRGALVLEGQGVEGGGLPFEFWRGLIRALALITPLDELEAGVLKEIVPDLERILEHPIADVPPLLSESHQRRLVFTLVDVMRRVRQPLVILLEDLHWSLESLEPLKILLRDVATSPWLIVGTFRDDERPDLPATLPEMGLLSLPRLSPDAVEALSAAMLGEAGRQPDLVAWLVRETEGNAFFMVEVVRALAEEAGSLADVPASPRTLSGLVGGVQRVVARRLARVPDWAQPALRLAAVLGRRIDLGIMARELPDAALEHWLAVCANAAVLDTADGGVSMGWRFAHDKLRQGVLASLSPVERPRLHQRAAEALESTYPGETAYAEVLLDHWLAAGDIEKALDYTLIAARWRLDITAQYPVALALLERGLRLVRTHLTTKDYRARLLLLMGDAQEKMGDYPASLEHYDACLRATDQPDLIWRALAGQSFVHLILGNRDKAVQTATRALDISRQVGDWEGMGMNSLALGSVAMQSGAFAEANAHLEESLRLFQTGRHERGIARSLRLLGIVASRQKDYAQAENYYFESLQHYSAMGDRAGVVNCLGSLGLNYYRKGQIGQALDYLERELAGQIDMGDKWTIANSHINLLFIYLLNAETDKATTCMREGLSLAAEISATILILEALLGAAHLALAHGDAGQAAYIAGFADAFPAMDAGVRQDRLVPLLAELHHHLPASDLEAMLAAGAGASLEGLIAGALGG